MIISSSTGVGAATQTVSLEVSIEEIGQVATSLSAIKDIIGIDPFPLFVSAMKGLLKI